MRKLMTDDIFLLSEIVDKLDIDISEIQLPDTKKKLTEDEMTKLQNDLGMKLIFLVSKRMYKAKEPINELLASMTEKTVEEIKKQSLTVTFNQLKELFLDEELVGFFQSKFKAD